MIRYRWAKVFLGWSQYRERRVPPMEPTVTCPWPRRSFKSEVIGFGLTWRGMGSARSTWLRHGTHELISLCFSHQICRGTGQMFSHAESLRPHPIMRLLMMMMNIKIASEKILSTSPEGYRVWHTPEEVMRMQRPKRWDNLNKDQVSGLWSEKRSPLKILWRLPEIDLNMSMYKS